MTFSWVSLICTLYYFISPTYSISSVSLVIDNTTTIIYNNNSYSPQFISSHSKFSCSSNNLFTYKQSPQNLANNSPYQISITGINQSTSISISSQYGIISPSLSQYSCSSNCTLNIFNNCPSVDLFHYFDTFLINIQGIQTLTYNVICNKDFGNTTF